MAYKQNVPVQVLSSFDAAVGSDLPGTLLTREEDIMEAALVNGIAYTKDEAKITLLNVPDTPGIAAHVFGPLADAGINVDMIIQNISPDGRATDMTFTVPEGDLPRAEQALKKEALFQNLTIRTDTHIAKLSVVGIGMRTHAGVAQTMFKTLADHKINIQAISTSEIKISVLIDRDHLDTAIRALHTAYGLDHKGLES